MVHEQYHPKLLAIAPMRITIRHGFSPWQSQNERPMVGQNQDSKLTLLPQQRKQTNQQTAHKELQVAALLNGSSPRTKSHHPIQSPQRA